MNFNSFEYAIFLGAVLGGFWLVPLRWRLPLLLVASYLFYASLDWRFLGLLLASTTVDYWVGLRLGRTEQQRRRQWLLLVSVVVNLGILGFFKYFDFFYVPVAGFLRTIGLDVPHSALRVVLPVGLSFYTFQSMSYTIDVYRRQFEPRRSFVVVATYVAFFPQLLAGPIERSRKLIPQLENLRARVSAVEVREAFELILLGLFKKVAIADVASHLVVDAFSDERTAFGGINYLADMDSWIVLLMGVVAGALLIYTDFSGYSDIARGSAKLLGIDLSRNFLRPFRATTMSELWRRWHVTIMDWFRDYVFIPLGGSRGSRTQTYRNIMVVFLGAMIWHGANGLSIAAGVLAGSTMVAEAAIRDRNRDRPTAQLRGPRQLWGHEGGGSVLVAAPPLASGAKRMLAATLTFGLFCPVAAFFLFDSVAQAWEVWSGIFTLREGQWRAADLLLFGWIVATVLLTDEHQKRFDAREDRRLAAEAEGRPREPPAQSLRTAWWSHARDGLYVAGIIVFSGGPQTTFFYFQY